MKKNGLKLILVGCLALGLTSTVVAAKDFNDNSGNGQKNISQIKTRIISHLKSNLNLTKKVVSNLEKDINCVQSANNREALKECRKTEKAQFQSLRAERKKLRAERKSAREQRKAQRTERKSHKKD